MEREKIIIIPYKKINVHSRYHSNHLAETKDLRLHGALFYIRKHLTQLYLPAENHLGFSPWPFYEQSDHAGHRMAQA